MAERRINHGMIVSATAHVAVLLWTAVSFAARPLDTKPTESMPIDIISASEFSQITAGSKTAPKKELRKPLVEKKAEQPKPVEDQSAKIADKEITTASTQATAPPPPAEAKVPLPEPKPRETKAEPKPEPKVEAKVKPEPKPEPKAEPKTEAKPKEIAKPEPEKKLDAEALKRELAKAEPKKVEPKPPEAKKVEPKPPEPKVVEPKKPEPKLADATPAHKPDSKPEKKHDLKKPEPQAAEAKPDQPKFDANHISALLDKRKPQRLAAAGDIPNTAAPRGSVTGTAAQLSQNEIDALRSRIQQCWNVPVGATDAKGLVVLVRILFKPDGSLAAAPRVVNSGNGPFFQVAAESAMRAVSRCAPYTFMPVAKYETWKDVEITFDPRDLFRG